MSVSDLTGVRNVALRYFKNDQVCQVSYAISLRDGRILRLDVPVSQEYTEQQAKEYSRPLAENYVVDLLKLEADTGRFACCSELQSRGHRNRCLAL